jgi:hypothetical protein
MKKIIAGLGALTLAAGLSMGLTTTAVPVLASTRATVIYDAPAQTFNWSSPSVRPGYVTLDGQGNAIVRTSSLGMPLPWNETGGQWVIWDSTWAESHGTLIVNTCTPDCAAGNNNYYAATLLLYRPEWHGRTRYFSRMELKYYHGYQRAYTYSFAWNGASFGWTGGPS